jgi:alcohol dehydrogenase (cytochrome c)
MHSLSNHCRPSAALLAAAAAGALLLTHAATAQRISPAPAFNAERLSTLPTDEWITNGGTISNQRYSPLTLLNPDNVAGLKAKWRTAMGTGANPGNSGQAQILVFDGVLYIVNGDNDVFAIELDGGEILWTYRGNPDSRAGNPFGRSSRGVALGDGKVYVGMLDATVAAIDQRTGAELWRVAVAPWQEGYSITSAPLYYDGMVITGVSGGVMGRRGRVTAFDADSGAQRWVFYTIPGPGEVGHDTWPQDGNAWEHGGAPVWQTPAVDPDLGLIYFSTGNPGPVLNGAVRPGNNLFNNSIVALDVATGEYRWHFQQVHHDIWDYDSPNPIVLFEAEYDGVRRRGLVQVGKTGWAYILDRATGEPLLGIQERPVPQEPRQATSPTQPYPLGDAIVPQEIDIVPEDARRIPGSGAIVNNGRIFTPFWTERLMMKPNAQGGANWPPSSFDPETNLLYVCATDRVGSYAVSLPLAPPVDNQPYFGGSLGQSRSAPDRGIFAALDVRTNRLVWRQQWLDHCYSGSVVTRGGLVFVGRSDGRLTALDKRTGEQLWEFMTDAGVNSTVTTFEHRGQQYVVVHAGGGVFADGKRGDGIWMFSLDGTIEPVAAAGAPASGAVAALRAGAAAPASGNASGSASAGGVANGERIYREACLPCHGATGEGGEGGGASLVTGLTTETVVAVAADGRNNMPAFAALYSAEELRDVAQYIVEMLGTQRQ